MSDESICLNVNELKKYFPIKKGFLKKTVGNVRAVDDVSFTIKKGETLGLVGESGSGKTTVGRCIMNLYKLTGGNIDFIRNDEIIDLSATDNSQLKEIRKDIQMIFQDPYSSLNPRMTVEQIITEPLIINNIGSKEERKAKVIDIMRRVGLDESQLARYPHQFSGGQRQRIGIARVLILNPRLIICDEPVSALDVSVQAQVLNMLGDLQKEFELTYLFIAHDLSVVEYISDRVAVMYLGKLVEISPSSVIYKNPKHPYTEALIGSSPKILTDKSSIRKRVTLNGQIPSPSNPPTGCRFQTRCKYAIEICKKVEPMLAKVGDDENQLVACHRAGELNLIGY